MSDYHEEHYIGEGEMSNKKNIMLAVWSIIIWGLSFSILGVSYRIVKYLAVSDFSKGKTNDQDITIVNCFYANMAPAGILFVYGGVLLYSFFRGVSLSYKTLSYFLLLCGLFLFITNLVMLSAINSMTFIPNCNMCGRWDNLVSNESDFMDEVNYKKQLAIGLWIIGLVIFLIGLIMYFVSKKIEKTEREKLEREEEEEHERSSTEYKQIYQEIDKNKKEIRDIELSIKNKKAEKESKSSKKVKTILEIDINNLEKSLEDKKDDSRKLHALLEKLRSSSITSSSNVSASQSQSSGQSQPSNPAPAQSKTVQVQAPAASAAPNQPAASAAPNQPAASEAAPVPAPAPAAPAPAAPAAPAEKAEAATKKSAAPNLLNLDLFGASTNLRENKGGVFSILGKPAKAEGQGSG